MTFDVYHLTIRTRGRAVLLATLEREPVNPQLRVTDASIDHEGDQLTPEGMDAFRCLSLGETMLGLALGVPAVDPFAERVQRLEAEVTRLQQELQRRGGSCDEAV